MSQLMTRPKILLPVCLLGLPKVTCSTSLGAYYGMDYNNLR